MNAYSRSHVADAVLERDLKSRIAKERDNTAEILADMAEVDARKLYVPAGYPSMYAYCVGELQMSEEAAFKRIRVARAARQYPAIFPSIAAGRLHLTTVVLMASYLTSTNAIELLGAAEHKSRSEVEQLLAQRFPRPDVPTLVQPIASSSLPSSLPASPMSQLSPGTVGSVAPGPVEIVESLVAANVEVPRPKLTPLAPGRFAIQFTMDKDTHDMLEYAQALLSHAIPSGDAALVFRRVLQLAIPQLEKQKFAATEKPRCTSGSSENPRYIPAHVKHTVWKRDQGQCTFVSDKGQRCPSRKFLEFDHVDPVGRGGQATIDRVRLRCRAHSTRPNARSAPNSSRTSETKLVVALLKQAPPRVR